MVQRQHIFKQQKYHAAGAQKLIVMKEHVASVLSHEAVQRHVKRGEVLGALLLSALRCLSHSARRVLALVKRLTRPTRRVIIRAQQRRAAIRASSVVDATRRKQMIAETCRKPDAAANDDKFQSAA